MLSIDRKKTEKIDFIKPLQQYIRNQYNSEVIQDYNDTISQLQQLREDMRNSNDKNEATKDILCRYYTFIISLEIHFPISENNIRISFSWNDIFKLKKVAQYNIYYEKACILFNIGAIYSQLASIQNKVTTDGLKNSFQYFQNAAGAFIELKDLIEKHPQPNVLDLTIECVNFLISLMSAQAQECFYEKANKDNVNQSLQAKLANGTADLYEQTLLIFNSNSNLQNLIPKTWIQYVQMKIVSYKAMSQYQQSLIHSSSDQYGLQVARLKSAFDNLEDFKKKIGLKGLSNDLTNWFTNVNNLINKAFTKAEKENDTIYHDLVPSEDKLSIIEKKIMVKPHTISENIKFSDDKDPFGKLIPFAVTEKLSIYQDRKDSLVREELKAIDENNQLAIGSLSSMNLPGAIEALDSNPGLPEGIQSKMNIMKSENGEKLIREQIDILNKLAGEDSSILERALKILDQEEKDDNEMRQYYGSRWQRTPSHTLTANLRQEAAKFKGNMDHARKSDAYIFQKFQDNQKFITKLNGTPQDILNLLPSNSSTSNNNIQIISALKQSLGILDKLIAERAELRNQLTILSQNDNITSKLLNTAKSDEEIFTEELKKYETIQNKLQKNYSEQQQILNKIQKENDQFVASRQTNNNNNQREQILQQLNDAFKVYNELKSHLKEGIQFYTNFQEILKQFCTKCEDFAFARQTEKQDILKDFQTQSIGFNQSQQQQQTSPLLYSSLPPPGGWQPNMKPVYQYAPKPPSYEQQFRQQQQAPMYYYENNTNQSFNPPPYIPPGQPPNYQQFKKK